MTANFTFAIRKHTQITRLLSLCFSWCLCLIIGVLIALSMPQPNRAILDAAMSYKPSWIMILLAAGLPLLLYWIGVWYGWSIANYVLVILEGLCRGFCGFWIFLTYGSGAWLIRCGFLFSSALSTMLLWWLICKHNLVGLRSLKKDICITTGLLTVFTIFDRILVLPFSVHLSMYI